MKVNRICIVGLGYVGLPLAAEFGKKYETIGFDINKNRLEELKKGIDRTLEVEPEKLKQAQKLVYTSDVNDIKSCNFFIVTVPTPVNEHKQPDLTPVVKGTETVAKVLKKGDIVIYSDLERPGAILSLLHEVGHIWVNREVKKEISVLRIAVNALWTQAKNEGRKIANDSEVLYSPPLGEVDKEEKYPVSK
ncbi:MAG TPA: hypothetical protein PKM18_13450, partial [bacterium]|nr:hypothetical protein [bacterium]